MRYTENKLEKGKDENKIVWMPGYVDEKTENIKISYEVMANVKKI